MSSNKRDGKIKWMHATDQTPFDGPYLCLLRQVQECGTVWTYMRVKNTSMNEWQLDQGEVVVAWQCLPDAPPFVKFFVKKLDCPSCGKREFLINPMNESEGTCYAEGQILTLELEPENIFKGLRKALDRW